MDVVCPYIVWRISPFSTVRNKFTQCFTFLKCDWRWEYVVHTKDEEGLPFETVSIYLRRLSAVSDGPITRISVTASIRDSDGQNHSEKVAICVISPLVTWLVWKRPKSYILENDFVENNSCTFRLTIEPLGNCEDLTSLRSDEKCYTLSCLDELRQDFNNLLQTPDHADVILKCGKKEFKAHKAILCFRSKKLADMLEFVNHPAEMQAGEFLDELDIRDMDPDVFEILIRYTYTACLPDLTVEQAKKIYEAADEYLVTSLKTRCARFMIENFISSEAVNILLLADKCNDDYLKWAVSSRISYDLNILFSEEWRKFSKTNQKLAINVFQIFTERVYKRMSSDTS